jgi:phosphatidylinositol glycan class B
MMKKLRKKQQIKKQQITISPLQILINRLTEIITLKSTKKPWWSGIHIIAIAALALRLTLAFVSDYIYHPDEIFQYLEQGHRLVFGYGYIPWEFRFGIRSYMIPGFISGLLYICKLLQIDDPAHYIMFVKAVCCVLSISVIYSAYVIGRNTASEAAGRLAAVFTCIWYELIYFAHKPTPEALSAYLLLGALACVVSLPEYRKPLMLGLLAGLSVALRLQYSPIIAVLGIVVCFSWNKMEIIKSGLVFIAVLVLTGYLDYITWGQWFSSSYHNYLFNNEYKISEMFGTSPAYFYLYAIVIASAGIFCLTMLSSLFLLPVTWLLAVCVLINIISHSVLGHKEYRFILASIPLLLILTAIVVKVGIAKYMSASKQNNLSSLAVGIMVLASTAGLFNMLPYQREIYPQPIIKQQDILRAYKILYHEPDLAAILNTHRGWGESGGYYYLHRDIPIYFPYHLRAKQINSNEIDKYVSHIICHAGMPDIRGFKVLTTIGNLQIRKQITHPAQYMIIDGKTKDVYHPGIDDRYIPAVKRRF